MAPPDPLIGTTLDGRFLVEARLGSGGMAEVYRARHLLMEQAVALKFISSDRGEIEATRRFIREARSSFLLDHPNCVRVTDLGATPAGQLYLVMEYLDGRTLGSEVDVDGPLTETRALHIAAQIAGALGHAHDLGFVHRDLKPDNVMLLRRGADPDFAKVLDFGLAKAFDADVARNPAVSITPLTEAGIVFGTPEFMSPEQALGAEVGPRADLYGLGAVLYYMLTGSPPFVAATAMQTLAAHVRGRVVPPSQRRLDLAISPRVDELVAALLAKKPESRPASARAVADRLAGMIAAATPAERNRQVLASETLELSASGLGPLPHGAAGPAPDRLERSPAAGPDRSPAAGPDPSQELPLGASTGRRSRLKVAMIAAVVMAAAAALIAVEQREDGAEAVPVPEHSLPPRPQPTAIDAGAVLVATVSDAALPLPTDARPASAPADVARELARTRRATALRHVRAAEAARAGGNLLRQLAEADEALRIDPSSRRARELVGEALVKSGDRARGCTYLRAFHRTSAAVGCAD